MGKINVIYNYHAHIIEYKLKVSNRLCSNAMNLVLMGQLTIYANKIIV